MSGKSRHDKKKFAEVLAATGNQSLAAKAAAPESRKPRNLGCRLAKDPEVKALVETARKEVQAKVSYGLEVAMREAEEAIQFARQTENANAYVKAVELRSKLNGLLVEKVDMRVAGFQLVFDMSGEAPSPAPKPEDDDDVFS